MARIYPHSHDLDSLKVGAAVAVSIKLKANQVPSVKFYYIESTIISSDAIINILMLNFLTSFLNSFSIFLNFSEQASLASLTVKPIQTFLPNSSSRLFSLQANHM